MLDYVRGLHRPGDIHLNKHESIYHNDVLYQNVTLHFYSLSSFLQDYIPNSLPPWWPVMIQITCIIYIVLFIKFNFFVA